MMPVSEMPEDDAREPELSHTTRARYERSDRYGGKRQAFIDSLGAEGGDIPALLGQVNQVGKLETSGTKHVARAVIYLRVSTEEQARAGGEAEGFSIPFQRDACTEKVRQLPGVLVEEYVDAGESAKSARRPQLQRMLKELRAKKVNYVVVHKIDRLARNRADDVAINAAIAKAGAKLVSVAEPVDETPAGKLLYNMMAGFAQYYSDNLAAEVLKGMSSKAKKGGTPFKAPLGYLNFTEFMDGVRVSSILVDPDRAPLVKWAFEQYALGTWSLRLLVDVLNEKGLSTKATRKRTSKPLTLNGLHHLLRNPYYMGIVAYQGVFHQGKHEPLVSRDLWLRVQEVLSAHALSGEKDRKHNHYLRGTIFCGQCGSRLVYSENTGRGGTYTYYFCISRQSKGSVCGLPYVRLDKIEGGIEAFYSRFRLSESAVTRIHDGVLQELEANRVEAAQEMQRAQRRLADISGQEEKLLHAYYAGALPVGMMKGEMERFTLEREQAERAIEASSRAIQNLEETLSAALSVASRCDQAYLSTDRSDVRRMINQGLFVGLFISSDGQVERFELREPFATLLDRSLLDDLRAEGQAREVVDLAEQVLSTSLLESSVRSRRPAAISERLFICPKTEKSDGGAVRLGSNKCNLVRKGGLEPPRPKAPDPKSGASAIPPLPRALRKSLRQPEVPAKLGYVTGRLDVVEGVLDLAGLVDDEGGADDAGDGLAVGLLLAVGAVGGQDALVLIGHEREGDRVALDEFRQLFRFVRGDADDGVTFGGQ
jgi:site-specific DNA recombinase